MDPGLDALRLGDDAIPPVREGLPPRYRMRADAHYVEQLDSSLAGLAGAASTPSADRVTARTAAPPGPATDVPLAVFADCLTAVASSANLLAPGATLTQTIAVDLVRAEAARALQLLMAARVLKGEAPAIRRDAAVKSIVDRAVEATAAERQLRGVALTVAPVGREIVSGDEELLAASLGALMLAPVVLVDAPRMRPVSLRVSLRADGAVMLTVTHEGVELPHFWRTTLADTAWPDLSMLPGSVSSGAVLVLRAARRVAEMHGGRMTLDCSEGRTSLSIVVPAAGA